MNYPLISEYIEAIKAAEDNFEELTNIRPVLGDDGQPVMTSGNFAVVFKMKDEQSGKLYAVKCFTKEQERRSEAYRKIAKELKDVSSPYLVSVRYLEKELFVDTDQTTETEFPVLLMDWVDGVPLNNYIRQNINESSSLRQLLHNFKKLSLWLLSQPIAHGDLKPDNILVKQDGSLVLVDYDGMYVPSMKGETIRELGSPDFQNPHKAVEKFDENMDLFSLVSIFLSLSIIVNDSGALERFGAADRLLFSVNDYLDLQQSELFYYVNSSFPSNGKTRKIADVLYKLCKGEPISLFVVNNVRRLLYSDVVCTLNKNINLPSAEEYLNAISNYTFYFRTLEHLKIVTENNRVTYIKGTNSVIFKMQDESTGKYYAIKCYTDVKYDIYDRLELVKTKLNLVESPYLVKFDILYNEININVTSLIDEGNYYFPVVLMDWVDGVALDNYIPISEKPQDDFKNLINNYKYMSSWLLEQSFSHGDISPKNIIVTKDNKIMLIDYDNVIFSNEEVSVGTNLMKDADFCNPCQTSFKYENNVDNFSLISIMISLIYQFEIKSKSWGRYNNYYGRIFFFKKEDYTDLDKSDLFNRIDKCHSWDYNLSTFILCLKQQLRSVVFSKEEINFLFKDSLSKVDDSHHYRDEDINTKLEKFLVIFSSVFCVLLFIAPFILISYTQMTLLSVSLCVLFSSLLLYLFLFITASFRPDKKSRINIANGNYLGFGCLGSIGTFIPVLFMTDLAKDIINDNISWLHIPVYNETWYITAIIWIIFFLSNQIILASSAEAIYDYDTLKFDINNKRYRAKRENFFNRLSEDEYNYRNSSKFQNSRLFVLISINVLALLLIIYTLYCFYFLHFDLIFTNIIIASLSLGTSLLVKPVLKDKYVVYSHKITKIYWNVTLIRMCLPMITIPFAFAGFTDFLNTLFSISIPPYELGTKEFVINAILYILIYCSPAIEGDYV